MTTLGNFNKNALSDADSYIMTLFPFAIYFFFFIFFLFWKCHYDDTVKEEDENSDVIKP